MGRGRSREGTHFCILSHRDQLFQLSASGSSSESHSLAPVSPGQYLAICLTLQEYFHLWCSRQLANRFGKLYFLVEETEVLGRKVTD